MKDIIKKYLKAQSVSAIVMLVIGLGLLIFPGFFAQTVCYILGALAIAFAVSSIISYIRSPIVFFPMGYGIALFIIGIVLISYHKQVISILPLGVGIYLVINGISELLRALEYKKSYGGNWNSVIIPACITLAFGIILVLFPFGSTMFMLRVIGAALIYCAAENLFHFGYVSRKIDSLGPIEGSFTDPDDTDGSGN